MERSVNPNSPEEVRRAIQRSYGNTDTVAAGLAAHIVIVDAHHVRYTDVEAIAAIQGDASWNATDWDTAYGWGDHGVAGYLKADGSVELTGNLAVSAGITIDGRDIRLDGQDLDTLILHIGKVKVDAGATSDYLGATFNDGALRTGTGISFADGGNFVTLTTNDGEIAHDSLSGYDSNDHIDHTTITFSAGSGLAGGGTLAANRSFALDINGLAVATINGVDAIAFYDDISGVNKKASFTSFNSALDHGALGGRGDDDHTSYHTDGRAATWLAAGHETTYDHTLLGTGDPTIADDVKFEIGTGVDYWFIYNSSDTQFELWSTDVDGGGTDGVVWSVDDGTDDVVFTGDGSFGVSGVTIEGLQLSDARVHSECIGELLQAEANTGADETLDNVYEAMKFTADGNYTVKSIAVSLKRTGAITNGAGYLVFFLYTDVAGEPGVKLGTLNNITQFGSLTTSYKTYYSGISDGITLSSGTDYWIVFRLVVTPVGGTIQFERNSSGTALHAFGSDGSSWTTANSKFGWYEIFGEDDVAVYGASLSSIGILGESVNAVGVRGVSVNSQGVTGSSVNNYGLFGSSVNSHGLVGASTSGSGIYATSTHSYGCYGISTNSYGVRGASTNSYGVYGNGPTGVFGTGSANGVYGTSNTGTGVYGTSPNGRAAHFFRNVQTPSENTEVVRIEQDHASNDDHALVIQQDGTGHILQLLDGATPVASFKDGGNVDIVGDLDVTGALTVGSFSIGTLNCDNVIAASAGGVVAISGSSATGDAIYGTSTAGICGNFYRNVSTPGGSPVVLNVHQDNIGDPSVVCRIQGDGDGDLLQIWLRTDSIAAFASDGDVVFPGRLYCGGAGGSSYGVKGESAGPDYDDAGIWGYNTSSGPAIYCISNTGNGINAYGNHGRAALLYRNNGSPSTGFEVVRIEQDSNADSSVALVIQQDGTGNMLDFYDGGSLVSYFDQVGILKAAGYKSSDGTAGATADYSIAGAGTLHVKNGLVTGYTP